MSAPKMSYFDMCKAAIVALKDRTGSSPQAIKAFITATYPDVTFGQHLMTAALKRGVEKGQLIKIKASFKLDPAEKAKKVKKVAAPTAAAVPKKAAPKAKAAAKPAAKKAVKKTGAKPKAAKKVVKKAVKKVVKKATPKK
ncbi:hypothetical protein B484DRAFT_398848 [Ochromonadaceae sp. CCMP2298]|nr:hypothetical protein B484DRAFT_398848 [Ochromonadaceae sp. CCMP2298]|eukprot:CAMPEP_0173245392 /NCGR_PEP_ID=MMETSP1142-20121109/16728_1 /TAXON_ID=483371 /ORGANISM="non described non described, Strain CCMP2298" /LENGTH=139 /DNA_ID=CAMNT_0014177483 /DNA_START=17 /DNA_END=436 /DNA_ORIENTATION=+